jgi:hypothetical protein
VILRAEVCGSSRQGGGAAFMAFSLVFWRRDVSEQGPIWCHPRAGLDRLSG